METEKKQTNRILDIMISYIIIIVIYLFYLLMIGSDNSLFGQPMTNIPFNDTILDSTEVHSIIVGKDTCKDCSVTRYFHIKYSIYR